METIVACHPALSTEKEWQVWVAMSCELWCTSIWPGLIWNKQIHHCHRLSKDCLKKKSGSSVSVEWEIEHQKLKIRMFSEPCFAFCVCSGHVPFQRWDQSVSQISGIIEASATLLRKRCIAAQSSHSPSATRELTLQFTLSGRSTYELGLSTPYPAYTA